MLEVDAINSFYGQSQVLFDMSLTVKDGEVVTLMGRNGMGKTTTIRSIMGLTPAKNGTIRFKNKEITTQSPYRIARLGIGLVPEGRLISPNLTVEENLIATANAGPSDTGRWTLDTIWKMFPKLSERKTSMGNQISGGEQQMLAIARALMKAVGSSGWAYVVTPKDMVILPTSFLVDRSISRFAAMAIRRSLARLTASGRFVAGRMTLNSSPPYLAATAFFSMPLASVEATSLMT